MAKVESTVTIARSVEEVFRFFLDLDINARKTDPDVESILKTPEDVKSTEMELTARRAVAE
jgi:hypothetical protein